MLGKGYARPPWPSISHTLKPSYMARSPVHIILLYEVKSSLSALW